MRKIWNTGGDEMLKVLLYGIATFLETGIGIWFFGKMFPKRERMERRHYFAEWVLYTSLIVTAYTFPKTFLKLKDEIQYMNSVIFIYFVGLIIYTALAWRMKKCSNMGGLFFVGMIISLTAQYWCSYSGDIVVLIGNVFPVLFLFILFKCNLIQAYLWEFFYLTSITLVKDIYIIFCGVMRKGYYVDFLKVERVHNLSEIVYWIVVCSIFFWILRGSMFKMVFKNILEKYRKIFWGISILLWSMTCVVYDYGKVQKNDLLFILGIFMLTIITVMILFFIVYSRLLENEKKIMDIQNNAIECRYKDLSEAHEKYRCLVHDEKHLISYITECLANGKIDDVLDFLKDVQCTLSDQEGRTWTGIQNLDFILNVKFRVMKEADIKFFCDLDVDTIPLKETDFVIVMGNLLDNAIEASQKCEEGKRIVNLTMKNRNDFFLVKIKNSCIKKAVMKKEKFISDKGEKHGWGIASVQHIVNQYNGEMDFAYDDKTFEVKILINNVL